MEHRSLSPQTLAAQALGETDLATGALAPVITMSTNYEQRRRNAGAMPGPLEAWLLQRGMPGRQVRPLPDGDQYLGFVFAEATTPAEVEKALTIASRQLHAVIE
jgi:L-aminoacid ligase-like protein